MKIIESFEELITFIKNTKDWFNLIAIGYIRVSTKEQADEGYSLDAQKSYLCRYGDAMQIPYIYFFIEQESAKASGRTEFTRMVNFFQKFTSTANCPFLFVEKTDRLLRNKMDDVTIDGIVEQCGLYIHYVKENNIQSPKSKASDNFLQSIRVAVAKFYIENLAEEASKGMRAKAEAGIYPSCAPMGYLNIIGASGKKIIIPDPERAPMIKKIFEWYVYDHKSIIDIWQLARQNGFTCPRGKDKIARNSIEVILHRPLYAGYFYWNGVRYNGTYEQLIPLELFNQAQLLLKKKAPYSGSQVNRGRDFTFRGVLKCGICGYSMIGEVSKKKYVYYHCSGNGDKNCPNKKVYVRGEVLESQAEASLQAISIEANLLPGLIETIRDANRNERTNCEEAINSLLRQIAVNKGKLDRLLDIYLEGKIDEATYSRNQEKIKSSNELIENNIQAYGNINPAKLEDGIRLLELVQHAVIIYKNQNTPEKRKLLKIVHSNLSYRDGILTAEYRKPFDILAVSSHAQQIKKAVTRGGDGLRSSWLPFTDSNHGQGD
jgi:DNA invertase Pin-like site-specific DNA recombinase